MQEEFVSNLGSYTWQVGRNAGQPKLPANHLFGDTPTCWNKMLAILPRLYQQQPAINEQLCNYG